MPKLIEPLICLDDIDEIIDDLESIYDETIAYKRQVFDDSYYIDQDLKKN